MPYSDCFFVESELIIAMPPSCNSSSIMRATSRIVWLKSTMMKSIISSKTQEETKDIHACYGEFIKRHGHGYKPAKSDKKLKHGIEKIQAKKDRREEKVVDPQLDKSWSLQAQEYSQKLLIDFLQSPHTRYLWANRNDILQVTVIFFLFYMMLMQLSMRWQMGALLQENRELKEMVR